MFLRSENLGTLNTHFVTPNGLDGIDKIISVATENKKEAESKAEPQESQRISDL